MLTFSFQIIFKKDRLSDIDINVHRSDDDDAIGKYLLNYHLLAYVICSNPIIIPLLKLNISFYKAGIIIKPSYCRPLCVTKLLYLVEKFNFPSL